MGVETTYLCFSQIECEIRECVVDMIDEIVEMLNRLWWLLQA